MGAERSDGSQKVFGAGAEEHDVVVLKCRSMVRRAQNATFGLFAPIVLASDEPSRRKPSLSSLRRPNLGRHIRERHVSQKVNRRNIEGNVVTYRETSFVASVVTANT